MRKPKKQGKPLPEILPCSCGGSRNVVDMENWNDMRRIMTCGHCGRKVWAETWRAVITCWNKGLSGSQEGVTDFNLY